ncbi:LacI family DNA-binding transcriptional regulator [Echinicola jeungdonensis]|uniref:LacI family DNA-binding transcriptional regulator n=1 Tax=Echinicola jeungdonensis TaxID=709343 RepID=A0ABV5J5V5_9BACT|nr:LacI family DNA-binding transcriptional regulator [Echinicola jeungdonensis]MDN3670622.1 LacI family DNA-binding transcriptional regulator [Echinicola jeungdonensis]
MSKRNKATIHDIASKLGITASTVSRALNNHPRISDATKKLVQKTAREVNYQPNNIAAALRIGKSRLIGIIVPTANRNFFSSVVRGIEELANKLDYKVIICQSYENYKKEVQTIDALLSARVDGIIMSIGKNTEKFDHLQRVLDKSIPLVLFDRITDQIEVNQVVIDDYMGAYKSVQHLIDNGYKRIAHFTNPRKINIYSERLRGYYDALKDNGIPLDPELVIESNMQLEDGKQNIVNMLESNLGFDAIFSSSDYAAMGALQMLKEKNIKVPDQVGLVGFGNEPFTSFTEPSITTIDQVSIPMGNVAAELFFELLKADPKKFIPQKTVLKPELIIRGSSVRKIKETV